MIRRLLDAAVRVAFVVVGFRALFGRRDPDRASTDDDAAPGASSLTPIVKRFLAAGAVLLLVLGLAGALVVVSGIVPIRASSGHWAITAWFLDFAKQRSVDTYTILMDAPSLDSERLTLQGAGQFHLACRPCHGSPGLQQPVIAAQMTPRPPNLSESVGEYEARELFYIVKHGIKLTGMPAWPAQRRDDEVWAMVAFLRRLPQLDRASYERLVSGTRTTEEATVPIADLVTTDTVPRAITETCSRCHGVDGLGRGAGAFPKLAGQRTAYLRASLEAYAQGNRHSGVMGPVAAALDADDLEELAQFYAARPAPATPHGSGPDGEVERGRQIALAGIPERLVPPCSECHGPGAVRRNPHYPNLSGQYADYLALQLSLFKAGARGGTPYEHIMRKVAAGLDFDQMRAVARYYASLPAGPPRDPQKRDSQK
jgi:cytochrome c553